MSNTHPNLEESYTSKWAIIWKKKGQEYIQYLDCKTPEFSAKSFNLGDIENKYCWACYKFHKKVINNSFVSVEVFPEKIDSII